MSREQSSDALDPADLPAEETLETADAQSAVRDDDEVAAELAEAPESDLEVVPGEAEDELDELEAQDADVETADEDEELADEDEVDADDPAEDDEPVIGAASTKAERDAKRRAEREALRKGGKAKDGKGSKAGKSGKGATAASDRKVTPAGSKKHRSSEESAVAAAAAAATKRQKVARDPDANPAWFKPVMFGFLILGFLWIIVYYLSNGRLPIQELAAWNILIGFGIAFIGFLMTTNWK